MEIIVGKLAGFCFGVNNAVTKAEEIVKKEVEIKEPESIDLDITSPIKEIEESKKEKKEDDVELL